MAATRLRRTFHYPTESDDEDAVEQGMDEQGTHIPSYTLSHFPSLYILTHTLFTPSTDPHLDQTHLISSLSAHDTSSTRLYTLALCTFPLIPALLHIPLLARSATFLPSLSAIASLLASAYALYFLPLPPVKVGIINTSELKTRTKSGGYAWNTHTTTNRRERRPVPYMSDDVADVLAKYIVSANSAICVLLALFELWHMRTWSGGITVGGGYLPGFVLSVVLWARRELRVVDLGELEGLKYGGKAT
jgi:hypothetical protein